MERRRRPPIFRPRAARLIGLGAAMVAAALGSAFLLLPLAVASFVRLLDFTLNACVWLAASLSAGADGWTILAAVGRATGEALLNSRVLSALGALVGIGALAMYGLQRLLGPEEESSR